MVFCAPASYTTDSEGCGLGGVPADRPEVLDEPGRRVGRRPPIEVEHRRSAGAADQAAHGCRVCRVFPSAHDTRLRNARSVAATKTQGFSADAAHPEVLAGLGHLVESLDDGT